MKGRNGLKAAVSSLLTYDGKVKERVDNIYKVDSSDVAVVIIITKMDTLGEENHLSVGR